MSSSQLFPFISPFFFLNSQFHIQSDKTHCSDCSQYLRFGVFINSRFNVALVLPHVSFEIIIYLYAIFLFSFLPVIPTNWTATREATLYVLYAIAM